MKIRKIIYSSVISDDICVFQYQCFRQETGEYDFILPQHDIKMTF